MTQPAAGTFLDDAFQELKAWLLSERSQETQEQAPGDAASWVFLFLKTAVSMGFALELLNEGTAEHAAWIGYWTHRAYRLEGFKQPPHMGSIEEARLLACRSLLRNEWCLQRLK